MTHKVLIAVLRNFLGTFTSRNSDSHGYWVFGFAIEALRTVDIDLLSTTMESFPEAHQEMVALSRKRFLEQLQKNGLSTSRLQAAHLVITRGDVRTQVYNDHAHAGYSVNFHAYATSDLGKKYEAEASVFVAPHDPQAEHQSARASWPPFERERAESFVGKRVLLDATVLDHNGMFFESKQWHGTIVRADDNGFEIDLINGPLKKYVLPPDWRLFTHAPPEGFRMQATGEILRDLDLIYAFTVRKSHPPSEGEKATQPQGGG